MSSSSVPADDAGRTVHQPVLVRETMRLLALQPGLIVVDGTVGAGGHSQHLLKAIGPQGQLFGLDRDPQMLARASAVLTAENCHLINASYRSIRDVLDRFHVDFADRILLDLGLSSDQLAEEERGFRFTSDSPLDLRFDQSEGQPAWKLLQTIDADQLETLLRDYGEEPQSRRIAQALVDRRKRQPLQTARELAEFLAGLTSATYKQASRRHPATRVFQALRIAVNNELDHLEETLSVVFRNSLRVGGRAVVITFHSLEDRLVKSAFRNRDQWENLTPKPIAATSAEIKVNPRSRTAKVRAAIRKA